MHAKPGHFSDLGPVQDKFMATVRYGHLGQETPDVPGKTVLAFAGQRSYHADLPFGTRLWHDTRQVLFHRLIGQMHQPTASTGEQPRLLACWSRPVACKARVF